MLCGERIIEPRVPVRRPKRWWSGSFRREMEVRCSRAAGGDGETWAKARNTVLQRQTERYKRWWTWGLGEVKWRKTKKMMEAWALKEIGCSPWNSLQRIYGHCCCCLVTTSCSIFCDPRDCSPSGSSEHGIFQAKILELLFPSPGDLPGPGTEPVTPALAGKFFTTEPLLPFH